MNFAKAMGFSALLLAGGCGRENTVAGKPGGDQTENGITARLLDSAGIPVVGARVQVHRSDWLATGDASDSSNGLGTSTNSDGRFSLRAMVPGAYRVEIENGAQAAQFGSRVSDSLADAGLLTARPTGSVEGMASTPGSLVGISGLRHWARADANGHFRIDSLPPGVVELRSFDGSYAWTTVPSGAVKQAGRLRADPQGQILIDDFEDGDTRHRWAPLVNNGWWYAVASSGVSSTPAPLPTQFWSGFDSTTGRGRFFHARFGFDSAKTNPWAEVGVGLGGPSVGNLGGLSEVVFWTKGSGWVTVHLDSKGLGRVEYSLPLPSTWQEIHIPFDSFHLGRDATSGTTPSKILAISTGMGWEFVGDADFWLDEIRLIGPTARSIWGDVPTP